MPFMRDGAVGNWAGAPMTEFLACIIGALVAGALAKAGKVGGRAVADADDALRALILIKLGRDGVLQSLEDDPRSETAQGALPKRSPKPV